MDLFSIVADILEIVKGTPAIVQSVKDALQAKGYTVADVESIFADVLPPDKLGIEPGHPVATETSTPLDTSVANPPVFSDIPGVTDIKPVPSQAQVSQAQPFIHATHVPIPGAPVGLPEPAPGVTPPPVPFERAR